MGVAAPGEAPRPMRASTCVPLRRVQHDRPQTVFAERERPELFATGETVRKRRDDTREQLTPPEEQIARLALAGRTNQENGGELCISPRNVEWHLKSVCSRSAGSVRASGSVTPPTGSRGCPLRLPNSAVATRP